MTFSHVMRGRLNILRHSEARSFGTSTRGNFGALQTKTRSRWPDFERALSEVYLEARKKAPASPTSPG